VPYWPSPRCFTHVYLHQQHRGTSAQSPHKTDSRAHSGLGRPVQCIGRHLSESVGGCYKGKRERQRACDRGTEKSGENSEQPPLETTPQHMHSSAHRSGISDGSGDSSIIIALDVWLIKTVFTNCTIYHRFKFEILDLIIRCSLLVKDVYVLAGLQ
jgi:hypothetical protein